MLAYCRPLVRHSALIAKSRPFVTGRSMASAAPKQEWLVIVPDYPGAFDKRMEVRPAHLKDITQRVQSGFYVLGGGTLDEPVKEGELPKINGSALVAVANTKEEVMEALRNDVYNKNNVWDLEKVQIYPFKSAIRTAM